MASLDKMAHHKAKRRPNDGPFRRLVMAARGEACRAAPGCKGPIQAAHIWGKGQTGPSEVENGVPLCAGHHQAYDGYRLKLRPEWLDSDQIAWLEDAGYVAWAADGQPYGRGWRRFEYRLPAPGGQKRGEPL
jgi:hypothetical protein